MFCGEKNNKKKVKKRSRNEKIVQIDVDAWYYANKKTFIRVRKKQWI